MSRRQVYRQLAQDPGNAAGLCAPAPGYHEIARAAGVEFLSAPKFIAEISFADDDEWCHVAADGSSILHLAVCMGPLLAARRTHVNLVTHKQGYLLRWEGISSEHDDKHVSGNPADAALELGSHRIADGLRQMHLGQARVSEYSPSYQCTLSPVLETYKA